MIIFYFLVTFLILLLLVFLALSLKSLSTSQKVITIFLSISFCFLGLFLWFFSGIASRYTYPYQSAHTAKVKVNQTEKALRFFPLIKDARPQQRQNKTIQKQTVHDNNIQMQALADSLEQKLQSGESAPQSYSLLARTREAIGQKDKAALALLKGVKSFPEGSEMHLQFKQEIKAFIERGYQGESIDKLKEFLP